MKSALLAAAALTACTPAREPPATIWLGDPERVWALRTLQGERVKERAGYVATVRLNPDHSVSGTVACNSIGAAKLRWRAIETGRRGAFDQTGQGAGIMTTALCLPPAAATTAGRFWGLMETARAWSIRRGELTIVFGDGSDARFVSLRRQGF